MSNGYQSTGRQRLDIPEERPSHVLLVSESKVRWSRQRALSAILEDCNKARSHWP